MMQLGPNSPRKQRIFSGYDDSRGKRVRHERLVQSGSLRSVPIFIYLRGDLVFVIIAVCAFIIPFSIVLDVLWLPSYTDIINGVTPEKPYLLEICPLYIRPLIGGVVLCFALFWVMLGVFVTQRYYKINRVYHLSRSRCPACVSDMRGQPVESDGCVVCPNSECGHAWKLTDKIAQP